jgi:Fe-S-cluster-containing hydrogenase component 2
MAKRIVLRLDYCIGCRACEAACMSRFKKEARIRYGEVSETTFVPLACRHCEEPLCAAACPFDVIRRDEETGIVRQSSFHCVGCRSCVMACPFGVMDTRLRRSITQKCSLCSDREDGPRCVATCPTGALQFVDDAELAETKLGVGVTGRSTHWRRP